MGPGELASAEAASLRKSWQELGCLPGRAAAEARAMAGMEGGGYIEGGREK